MRFWQIHSLAQNFRRKQSTRSLQTLALIALALLLLSGCARLGAQPGAVTLDVTAFLPPEWQAIGPLQSVDIDDDSAIEYLYLYTYDQAGGGPVGALIFDPQAESIVTQSGERVAGRPASFPNPYAILPSYWEGAGQGFIAAPGQSDAVTTYQVAYASAAVGAEAPKPDTLILRGDNMYLTFVWWRNVDEGYGVSQLFAPGGFEGVDWTAWQRDPQPILSLVGSTPQYNRSLFCRKTRYDLAEAAVPDPDAYRQGVHYVATDLGLDFCYGAPAHPFYPEGVVLAYLLEPEQRNSLLTPELQADPERAAELEQISSLDRLVRVNEVVAYATVPVPNIDGTAAEPLTTVCAQTAVSTEQASSPEADQLATRWLLFTLYHQPPLLEPATPDRLAIANVNVIPAPAPGVALKCEQIISNPAT